MIRDRKARRAMKDPKVSRRKRKDTKGESEQLGFCPFCKILAPTLTVEKRRLGAVYSISCICKESEGKTVRSRRKTKAINQWRKLNVD